MHAAPHICTSQAMPTQSTLRSQPAATQQHQRTRAGSSREALPHSAPLSPPCGASGMMPAPLFLARALRESVGSRSQLLRRSCSRGRRTCACVTMRWGMRARRTVHRLNPRTQERPLQHPPPLPTWMRSLGSGSSTDSSRLGSCALIAAAAAWSLHCATNKRLLQSGARGAAASGWLRGAGKGQHPAGGLRGRSHVAQRTHGAGREARVCRMLSAEKWRKWRRHSLHVLQELAVHLLQPLGFIELKRPAVRKKRLVLSTQPEGREKKQWSRPS